MGNGAGRHSFCDARRVTPETALELGSTLTESDVTLAVRRAHVPEPGPDQVTVRIEAAPVNPSDLGLMFAGADLTQAEATEVEGLPGVRVPLTSTAGMQARLDKAMAVGNEGAGTVVAAGSSDSARALLGRLVAFLSGGSYAEHRTLDVAQCLPVAEGTDPADAAAAFVNPLTALGMVETMHAEGHRALVHTVGASNLGQMLRRICAADDIALVDIVRSPEQADRLRAQGAAYVCDSSAGTFRAELTDALRATGATIAFDAIGGGELAGTLLSAMEEVASQGAAYSRYGSDTLKQVYVYGSLDRGPMVVHRDFGLSWALGGWLLTPFLARIGSQRAGELRARVAAELTTTFASSYGARLSLTEAVDPAQVARYGRMASGAKALITP